jgi:hypothetical protein
VVVADMKRDPFLVLNRLVCNKISIATRALVVLIFIFLLVPLCNKNTGKLGMLTDFV